MFFAVSALPLCVTVWLALMGAYHGFGLWFQWLAARDRLPNLRMRPVDRRGYLEVLPRVLFNQTFILLPAMALVQASGLAFTGAAHIGLIASIFCIIALSAGHDVVQYAFHRLILHRPTLMNALGHAIHHSTTASCGVSACYMSPVDFFLEIVCPYLIPLVFIGGGADVGFHVFAVAAGAFGGVYEHSGYDFSLRLSQASGDGLLARVGRAIAPTLSSRAHAEHHARGNVSFSDGFGSSNMCDTIFRTRWDLVAARVRRRQREPAIAAAE